MNNNGHRTEAQKQASQQNGSKSYGPKTVGGKARSSRNSTKHGAFSFLPVIRGMESEQAWQEHRENLLKTLAPVGAMEIFFAERLALNSWRLNRVARFETEKINLAQEDAFEFAAENFPLRFPSMAEYPMYSSPPAVDVRTAAENAKPYAESEKLWKKVEAGKDTEFLTNSESSELLSTASQFSEFKALEIPDDKWPPYQKDFDGWTIGSLRILLGSFAARSKWTETAQFIKHLREEAMMEKARAECFAKRVSEMLDQYRRAHLLPDVPAMEKTCRYETHFHRQIHRDLHELQRLQAIRLGKAAPPPAALDVDISSEGER